MTSNNTHSVGNVAFDAPSDGLTVEKIGQGCWEVRLDDPNAEFKTAWIRFVVKTKEQVASIPQDAMDYFKLTYLGVEGAPAGKVSRAFGDRTVEGELHRASQPAAQTSEVYRIDQPDGGVLAISLARADAFDAARADSLFTDVAKTIHLTA